jgi:hypothetical protein
MITNKSIGLAAIFYALLAVPYLNAATIPAGTRVTVQTVSLVTAQSVPGRSFEAKLAQDLSVKGTVVARAGAKVFGKITSSRANPRRSAPLAVELSSISINGRNVPVKTDSVAPEGPRTARQAQYGHTAGTTVVNPGTTMQFQLLQPVTF